MTGSRASAAAQEWIAHDPDPRTAAELSALTDEQLAERFARPLTFGTAGLRGPLRGGPNGMNLAVVLRTTWGVGTVLKNRGLAGQSVVVGRDARHGSEEFARAAAEVLAAQGFDVMLMFAAVPTPVVAFTVRRQSAIAGIQITASHNPPSDNGYKVYFAGGFPIVPPIDEEIERAAAQAPYADEIDRAPVEATGVEMVAHYVERVAQVRRNHGSVRVALTPMHGVGGTFVMEALAAAGLSDVHVVESQFAPDPDFPTVSSPNPEEPGAVDALLELAAGVDADVAIALDPDADRCAVLVPTPAGWRMLSGNETGWLLGDYLLAQLDRVAESTVVASSVVSSRLLAAIAAARGVHHVETPTGFKWLSRADVELPGSTLVYAYEEAIGHCVDPAAVRDKDGISAAVLVCDLVAALRDQGRTVPDALDDLALRHGVHTTTAVSRGVADADEAHAVMTRLRTTPPDRLAGFAVTATDLLLEGGSRRTDAVVLFGARDDDWVRVVVRPSGTEPKLKSYIEVRCANRGTIDATRVRAGAIQDELVSIAQRF